MTWNPDFSLQLWEPVSVAQTLERRWSLPKRTIPYADPARLGLSPANMRGPKASCFSRQAQLQLPPLLAP